MNRKFKVSIRDPRTPLELLLNAEERIVTEDVVDRIKALYTGNDWIEDYGDDQSIPEYRRYGRLCFEETEKYKC